MDSRIVILLGAQVGRGMLTDMLQEEGIPQIELLDFLLQEPSREETLSDMGIYAFELMFAPHEEHAIVNIPILVRAQHYRDLEYPNRGRRSELLRSRSAKKGYKK